MHYYIRARSGSFRDDRHEFDGRFRRVEANDLTSSHFSNPKLEIVTEADHKKSMKKTDAEPKAEPEST